MGAAASTAPPEPAVVAAPPPELGSFCLKKINPDETNQGFLSAAKTRFLGFVNASMDDHKTCAVSTYKKAVGKIKGVTGIKAKDEMPLPAGLSAANGTVATASATAAK